MKNFESKVLDLQSVVPWRAKLRASGTRLVVTNGCFDILHLGHVTYLESARNLGDVLLVGVNSDASVRALKGPTRPVNSEFDRARVLAALESVSAVAVFAEPRAVDFLRVAQPEIYVKGGDYTLETLDQDERRAVEDHGGRIIILPIVEGKSTTGVLHRIAGS